MNAKFMEPEKDQAKKNMLLLPRTQLRGYGGSLRFYFLLMPVFEVEMNPGSFVSPIRETDMSIGFVYSTTG